MGIYSETLPKYSYVNKIYISGHIIDTFFNFQFSAEVDMLKKLKENCFFRVAQKCSNRIGTAYSGG